MPSHRRIALIVAGAFFMETLDATIVVTALPVMAADLGTTAVELSLAVTAYLAALAVFIPASGWLGDRFGARRVFSLAIVVFTAGSIGCGLAVDVPTLGIARFVQGAGGAMMVPVGRVVVLRSIDRGEIVSTMIWLTLPGLVAPLLGPPVGGFLATYAHWRWVFWLNVPVGLAGLVAARLVLPDLAGDRSQRFDAPGFVLTGTGLAALLLGLTFLDGGAVPAGMAAAMVVAGLVALALYVLHARRAERPILDLALLCIASFRNAVVGAFVFRAAVATMPFLLPILFQLGFGLSPFASGLLLVPAAVGALMGQQLAHRSVHRFGFRNVLTVNAVLAGAAVVALAAFTVATPWVVIVAVLFLAGAFRAPQFTNLNALMFYDVPKDAMGRATSLIAVAQQTSLAVGIALAFLALGLVRALDGAEQVAAAHFPPLFAVAGVFAALTALFYVGLPPDAGRAGNEGASPS